MSEGAMQTKKEVVITRITLGVTLASTILFVREVGWRIISHPLESLEPSVFLLLTCLMLYGNFVYQLCRLGHLRRSRGHCPVPDEQIDAGLLEGAAPRTVFLLPSYKEEERVVLQALLSCALQDVPRRRVVLLIDDPPDPSDSDDRHRLRSARGLPARVAALLEPQAVRMRRAEEAWEVRRRCWFEAEHESETLGVLHLEAARWFERQATQWEIEDHTDALFVDEVLRAPARFHRVRAAELRHQGGLLGIESIAREYRRLRTTFEAELGHFERKLFVNLSHEPNKAMNLNSYIDLLGRCWRRVTRPDGLHLEPAPEAEADLVVPGADYVVTLDADSLLLPGYARRLVHHLQQPDNARVAVAQTPYTAVPNAVGCLERTAGATTDIQHILHQGSTAFGATYWVGANAVLRKTALDDLRTEEMERGFPIARYVQDRTVIEDTESTIDLVNRGWSLYNYPARLSFSATPPDFGSLLIQRRRWANGGLIILPKLLGHLRRARWNLATALRAIVQIHYLISIATANVSFLLLLLVPFEAPLRSIWLPLAAAPYYFLYARDLRGCGYRWSDVLRVYALNLMLIPVNIGGVLRSLHQIVANRRVPFGRTPKIKDRTAVPSLYVLAEYALFSSFVVALIFDALGGRWVHASFDAFNGAFFAYVLVRLLGLRESLEDLARPLRLVGLRLLRAEQKLLVRLLGQVQQRIRRWESAIGMG
jgi:cellulose synthase/poly-beta-1,6-N-acetylglucosamine synthase-like glycosyltransferase